MSEPYSILLNGETKTMSSPMTIAELLTDLGFPPLGIAVAVNMSVVPRSEHAQYVLPPDARVEVIRAVGGG